MVPLEAELQAQGPSALPQGLGLQAWKRGRRSTGHMTSAAGLLQVLNSTDTQWTRGGRKLHTDCKNTFIYTTSQFEGWGELSWNKKNSDIRFTPESEDLDVHLRIEHPWEPPCMDSKEHCTEENHLDGKNVLPLLFPAPAY